MYLITRAEKMAGEVAQQVEASVIKSGNPQVSPGTHKVKGENQVLKVAL